MLDFARRRPVTAHFLLSFLIASGVVVYGVVRAFINPASAGDMGALIEAVRNGRGYLNIASIAAQALSNPALFSIFIYAAAPSIAALVLAQAGAGQTLSRLVSRLSPIGPEGRLAPSVGLYIGLLAAYGAGFLIYDWAAGPDVDAFSRLSSLGGAVGVGALVGLFLDEGGTLEELGWRGFEWPLLRDSLGRPLGAALVLGLLHWAWHLPREVFTVLGPLDLSRFLIGQSVFLILCLALSIVAVFCVERTGGSVWPAIFVHGGSNVWSKATEAVSPSFGFLDLRTLLVIVAALLILAFTRGRLTARAAG